MDKVREYKDEHYLYLQQAVKNPITFEERQPVYQIMEDKLRAELQSRGIEANKDGFYRSSYTHGPLYLTVRYDITRRKMTWLEDK